MTEPSFRLPAPGLFPLFRRGARGPGNPLGKTSRPFLKGPVVPSWQVPESRFVLFNRALFLGLCRGASSRLWVHRTFPFLWPLSVMVFSFFPHEASKALWGRFR